jgi:hypothetical protein
MILAQKQLDIINKSFGNNIESQQREFEYLKSKIFLCIHVRVYLFNFYQYSQLRKQEHFINSQ